MTAVRGAAVAALSGVLLACVGMTRPDQVLAADVDQPCSEARTQAEMTACWGKAAAEREQRVTALEQALASRLVQAGSQNFVSAAESARAAWQTYQSTYCELAAASVGGGSAAALALAICRFQLGGQRMEALENSLSDWSPK